jgi:SNF2 family DNA or RNA helicase
MPSPYHFSWQDLGNRILGSSDLFRARYAIPIERHGQTEPAERLRGITRPYILRRLKTDPAIIDDLPDKIEINQCCQLTTEQASLYQSVVNEMMAKIEGSEGIEQRGNVLTAMTKLKQVCNHPAQLLHDRSPIGRRSGKVIRLEEILDEILAEGAKVLCFTQYTEFAEMLLPHRPGRKCRPLSVRLMACIPWAGSAKQGADHSMARWRVRARERDRA